MWVRVFIDEGSRVFFGVNKVLFKLRVIMCVVMVYFRLRLRIFVCVNGILILLLDKILCFNLVFIVKSD